MSVGKNIEITAESNVSFEDAIKQGIERLRARPWARRCLQHAEPTA